MEWMVVLRLWKQHVLYVGRTWSRSTMQLYFVQHLSYKWHPQTPYSL